MDAGGTNGVAAAGEPVALRREALLECVAAAVAAPSIHNSQPWRFRVGRGEVEVYADRSRRLDVLDPNGRELLISVGASLFNLRVAMSGRGRAPEVELFPEPGDADLVARVRVGGPTSALSPVAELMEAIPRRHTNRQPFARKAIPAATLEALRSAAHSEGARLSVASSVARNAILSLVRTAEQRLRVAGEYRAELHRWTRSVHGRADGVPPHAFGPWDAMEALPLRDFGLTQPELRRPVEPFEPFPTIVVLSSDGDSHQEWVRIGQALQRVLLVATVAHIAATPMSQPLEIPALRELVTDPGSGSAQMILRLGYAPPTVPTVRRPLDDVLLA